MRVEAALLVVLALLALSLAACGDTYKPTVDVQRRGNTFTLIGNGDRPSREPDAQNAVARRAGAICAEHGLWTAQVYKLGDQRIVVVCR